MSYFALFLLGFSNGFIAHQQIQIFACLLSTNSNFCLLASSKKNFAGQQIQIAYQKFNKVFSQIKYFAFVFPWEVKIIEFIIVKKLIDVKEFLTSINFSITTI